MKYIQLIFSPTGGTQKVSEIVSSEWSSSTKTIDLSDPEDDFSKYRFHPEDVALVALPSFGGRVPVLAAKRLSKIHGNGARCVLLCVYGNRAYEDTLIEMNDIAEKCGFVVTAAISAIAEHSILHQYASGRPDAQDASQLKAYAKEILDKLNSIECGETSGTPIQIPGNRPYKDPGKAKMLPRAARNCRTCGLCAKICPAQAIDLKALETTDREKCIGCMRCVVKCPYSVRILSLTKLAAASLALKKVCSVRKDCELFI